MNSIENLNQALDKLIENYQQYKQEISSKDSIIFEKDQEIENLKLQLEQKSIELDALVNKISAALGQ